MIDDAHISKVLSAVRIQDVYGSDLIRGGNGRYKRCCPFHSEKSASFTIYDDGHYHCFGCSAHGNAASYIAQTEHIGYYDAIRKLAKLYQIDLEEKSAIERTPEEVQLDLEREQMRVVYEQVSKHYQENLYADTPESHDALAYATKRWGAEFVRRYGIGYALYSNDLLDFAEKQHIKKDVLEKLGLIKRDEKDGHYYDLFRCRIMIPIRSISHLTIAFTARLVQSIYDKNNKSGRAAPAKYFNSTNSPLFVKENCIFGIDIAYHVAAQEDKFYLVEGGPDVLRLQSIGVENTVASLGSSWSEHQLKQLHQRAHKLCLIPDIDKVPLGKPWGIGIESAIATAKKALIEGFESVTIIEIETSGPDKKVDADEHFSTIDVFKSKEEKDFILWYAEKLHNQDPNKDMEYIQAISELLTYVDDDHRTYFVGKLKHIIPSNISTWKNFINGKKRTQAQETLKKSKPTNTLDKDILDKYGFQEEGHHYVSVTAEGKTKCWSNFVLHPLFHIKDPIASSRLFEIINDDGRKDIVEMSIDEMITMARFRKKIESLGNFIWMAKEDQLLRLKQYLYCVTETAQLIRQLGWQRQWGFYAFGDGVFYNNQWIKANENGIVRLEEGTPEQRNYYLPAACQIYSTDQNSYQYERKFVHKYHGDFSLHDYVNQFVLAFGDNAKVAFAYLLAALFRDLVLPVNKNFPLLNVFGPKGSGKTELAHCLMAFFVFDNIPPNLKNSTSAAIAESIAQCCNALVHLDEYKNTLDLDKIEMLKAIWDGTGRTRMNIDKGKRETSVVDTGVILTGQEMTSQDNALFTRLIYLTTSTVDTNRTAKAREIFHNLTDMRAQGCTHLTLQLLSYRPQFEANIKNSWAVVCDDLLGQAQGVDLEERIFHNWAVPLAAFHALRNSLKDVLPFDYEDLLKVCGRFMKKHNGQSAENDEVQGFWDILTSLRNIGELVEGNDYTIEYRDKFRLHKEKGALEGKLVQLDPPRKILFIRHRIVLPKYSKFGKDHSMNVLPESSMKSYIESSTQYYFGESANKRFKLYDRTGAFIKDDQDNAFCLDYKVVSEKYNIHWDNDEITPETED